MRRARCRRQPESDYVSVGEGKVSLGVVSQHGLRGDARPDEERTERALADAVAQVLVCGYELALPPGLGAIVGNVKSGEDTLEGRFIDGGCVRGRDASRNLE